MSEKLHITYGPELGASFHFKQQFQGPNTSPISPSLSLRTGFLLGLGYNIAGNFQIGCEIVPGYNFALEKDLQQFNSFNYTPTLNFIYSFGKKK